MQKPRNPVHGRFETLPDSPSRDFAGTRLIRPAEAERMVLADGGKRSANWSGTAVFYRLARYTPTQSFQKLHPRSLLERR